MSYPFPHIFNDPEPDYEIGWLARVCGQTVTKTISFFLPALVIGSVFLFGAWFSNMFLTPENSHWWIISGCVGLVGSLYFQQLWVNHRALKFWRSLRERLENEHNDSQSQIKKANKDLERREKAVIEQEANLQRRLSDLEQLAIQAMKANSGQNNVFANLIEAVLDHKALPDDRRTMTWAEFKGRIRRINAEQVRLEEAQANWETIQRLEYSIRQADAFREAVAEFLRIKVQELWSSKAGGNNPMAKEMRHAMVQLVRQYWAEDSYLRRFLKDIGATADVPETDEE